MPYFYRKIIDRILCRKRLICLVAPKVDLWTTYPIMTGLSSLPVLSNDETTGLVPGGGMMSGDPKQMQYLVPASSKKVRGGGASTWNFDRDEQKWLYCTYGKMAVQLARRMDDKSTSCEVTVKHGRKDAIVGITAFCR
jgi:hypothetical protein